MFLPGLKMVNMPVEHVKVEAKVMPHTLPSMSVASLCSRNVSYSGNAPAGQARDVNSLGLEDFPPNALHLVCILDNLI